jgi:hypothetical protein
MRKRSSFLAAIAVLLLLGIALMFVGSSHLLSHDEQNLWRELSGSFGEALIIASLLALLVDPLAQHEFATEWGRDLYWAIFSPDAPQEFREALQSLAAPSGFIRRCVYDIRLTQTRTPSDMTVELQLNVRAEGMVLDRHGFRPTDSVFALARCDGSPSTYHEWSLYGPEIEGAQYSTEELERLGALYVQSSGRTILDQSRLPASMGTVPFRGTYEAVRKVSTTRRWADFYPLFQNRIVLEQVFMISGDVLDELDISVVQLGGETLDRATEERPDGRAIIRYSTKKVAFPGQASLVEWKPKVVARNGN